MALLKKKTRKAIRKSFKKLINKHGPTLAKHAGTALAAGLATYLGAGGKKSQKKLKRAVNKIPGGKKLLQAISSTIPLLIDDGDDSEKRNGHKADKQERREHKSKSDIS